MPIKNPPRGYHTVTPGLSVDGAERALEFFKKAFGAEETSRFMGPGGKIMHCEIRIGDSVIMVNDTMPEMGAPATTSSLWIYTDNVDAMYQRAVAAGARSMMEPNDAFWGDRFSSVKDDWGNIWSIATRIKELSPEEMRKAGAEFMKSQAGKPS
jgi:uncharacterized glyoxalase superfamily protein PhnB